MKYICTYIYIYIYLFSRIPLKLLSQAFEKVLIEQFHFIIKEKRKQKKRRNRKEHSLINGNVKEK